MMTPPIPSFKTSHICSAQGVLKKGTMEACRVCHASREAAKEERLVVTADHTIFPCASCGIYQTFPLPKNTAAFYQESYYSRQKSRRFVRVLEYGIKWFRLERTLDIRRRYPRGRILDIGCGRGLMLYYLRKLFSWEIQGTQISQTAHAYATTVLGVPVFLGDLSDMPRPTAPFTVVTLYHVLEHLMDPVRYLQMIHEHLASQGALVIEVPNASSWMARITREHWMGWDIPYHTFHFSPSSLIRLLDQLGFQVEQTKHWSVEFSTFIVLQSILNTIFEEKDYFYRLLQRKARFAQYPLKASACLLLGFALLPLSSLLAVAGSVAGSGEIFRIYARKRA